MYKRQAEDDASESVDIRFAELLVDTLAALSLQLPSDSQQCSKVKTLALSILVLISKSSFKQFRFSRFPSGSESLLLSVNYQTKMS